MLKLNSPEKKKQLKSFPGSINHLAEFIPNAASLTENLIPMLKEQNQKKNLKVVNVQVKTIEWSEENAQAFKRI